MVQGFILDENIQQVVFSAVIPSPKFVLGLELDLKTYGFGIKPELKTSFNERQ